MLAIFQKPESDLLKYDFGIREVFDMVTLDKDALCITPFHMFASQLQELARKDKPKGTIGIGAGVAMLDSEIHPDLAIYVKDLSSKDLQDKLSAVRNQKIEDLREITSSVSSFLPQDQETALEIIQQLNNPKWVEVTLNRFQEMGHAVKIVDKEFMQKLLTSDGTIVVESSHGVLTDRYYGFHPNVSRLRTIPNVTWKMLKDYNYDGEIFKLALTRSYAIRHGAGPLVTEDPILSKELLPGSHKEENRWQGKIRIGPLDFVALRYAINCCGGPKAFDGIAISWLDQIPVFGKWPTCNHYHNAFDPEFFTDQGEIKVRHGKDNEQINHQKRLGEKLKNCTPIINSHEVRKEIDQNLIDLCRTEVLDKLGIPVKMVSIGPTENNKLMF